MPTAALRRQDARAALQPLVEKAIAQTPVFDIHTHLYAPAFSNLLAAGIDELLTYHYLVSETFRTLDMPYDEFWKLDKAGQAELAWQQLFIKNSPISEACRGVLTTLNHLGLDVKERDLNALRQWFAAWDPDEYISHCMNLANVHKIGMTNSPFDDAERPTWENFKGDNRFAAGLRLDPLLVDWQNTAKFLASEGYNVQADFSGQTFAEIRRFLDDWTQRMQPMYAMVSLPPTFAYPDNTECNAILEGAVLPFCREQNLPLALMLGVKRAVNPDLKMAGDGVGRSDLNALQNLLQNHSDNKFLVTVLARENQHELCVLARKFRNLHVFGCWWFVNTPLLIEETTRMRLELIGPTFTPQHSDARVIDQIIYKWDHTRSILTNVLTDKYVDVAVTGWDVTPQEIERDVKNLLGGGFEAFIAR